MEHGNQGDGGEFFEQVIGDFPGHALAGVRFHGLGELQVFLLNKRVFREMVIYWRAG
jgi:hypothetical protein